MCRLILYRINLELGIPPCSTTRQEIICANIGEGWILHPNVLHYKSLPGIQERALDVLYWDGTGICLRLFCFRSHFYYSRGCFSCPRPTSCCLGYLLLPRALFEDSLLDIPFHHLLIRHGLKQNRDRLHRSIKHQLTWPHTISTICNIMYLHEFLIFCPALYLICTPSHCVIFVKMIDIESKLRARKSSNKNWKQQDRIRQGVHRSSTIPMEPYYATIPPTQLMLGHLS